MPQRGPRLAVIGPDGWLLDSWDFDPLPGANPIGDLVRQLRQTALECSRLGAAYLAAIAPTKASMVPEAVPRGLEPRPGIDALLAALEEDVDEVRTRWIFVRR